MNTTITVDSGVKAYMSYHKAHSRPNTVKAFSFTLSRFLDLFSGLDITAVPEADVAIFLEEVTDGLAQSTKSNRAGHLSAFFNFVKDTFCLDFTNPCSKGLIKKLYKQPRHTPPELLDKEIVDEIIYRTQGRERMMRRMNDYVREHGIGANDRIFPISYTTAYRIVKRLGEDVGVKLRPHDLRRHAATQASRSGVPLEMVSKVILRHADIATTQRYLGKISVAEASRMIESWLG